MLLDPKDASRPPERLGGSGRGWVPDRGLLASPPYSPEYVEGISVLKISLGARFRPRSGTKTPVLGRFEPDFWSLSAQSPHFQHAGVFSKVGIAPVQQQFAYLAEIGWCKELS
jgi:hypothetical protein